MTPHLLKKVVKELKGYEFMKDALDDIEDV